MPFDRPAARLKDYVLALRAIWESFRTEGPLKYEGEFYQHTLMVPFFNPGPIQHPDVPVYIAGVNTRLARLASELCDGFHFHPLHSPEYVRQVVKPTIREGAGAEGRDASDVELATSAFVISGENGEAIEEQREKMRAQTPSTPPRPATASSWRRTGGTISANSSEDSPARRSGTRCRTS